MRTTQLDTNIILMADNHNPSIATKDWLMQQGILTEAHIDFTHSPVYSSVLTETFQLFADQRMVRLDLRIVNEQTLFALADMMNKYVTALPHIPYHAMGFNSKWIISDIPPDDILKNIFVINHDSLSSRLGDDYNVGAIVSYNYHSFQTTLTVHVLPDNMVSMDFNFYANVSAVSDLQDRLNQFTSVMEYAGTIANDLIGD